MRNAVRARYRGIWALAAAAVLVPGAAGCETTTAAPETVVVEVPGPGLSPPAAPWTMAQLTYHACAVLDEPELARFGFESPGRERTPPQGSFCSWSGRDGAGRRNTLSFAPDHDDDYETHERVFREKSPQDTRTISLADRPAFLSVHAAAGPPNCAVFASVESGGLFRLSLDYESGAVITPQDCDTLVEIGALLAERMQ